jgi:hypothetical protein
MDKKEEIRVNLAIAVREHMTFSLSNCANLHKRLYDLIVKEGGENEFTILLSFYVEALIGHMILNTRPSLDTEEHYKEVLVKSIMPTDDVTKEELAEMKNKMERASEIIVKQLRKKAQESMIGLADEFDSAIQCAKQEGLYELWETKVR